MLNDMPLKCLGLVKDMMNFNIYNFFGFCKVEVYCPETMERPMLPVKFKGKTIYPVGRWSGVYFSEEVKAVMKLGYEFKFISALEFTRDNLFTKYISHFYNIKKMPLTKQKNLSLKCI
jgi:DNA polymerase type B, organellar and viral